MTYAPQGVKGLDDDDDDDDCGFVMQRWPQQSAVPNCPRMFVVLSTQYSAHCKTFSLLKDKLDTYYRFAGTETCGYVSRKMWWVSSVHRSRYRIKRQIHLILFTK
jgi:hypothetical protein